MITVFILVLILSHTLIFSSYCWSIVVSILSSDWIIILLFTSFLEFVVVNYLARWVQDPDIQKRKRDNAILDVSILILIISIMA